MWQRFTEEARRVILLAQEEARKLHAVHVGTEHLLLGLIRERDGGTGQLLQAAGLRLDRVRAELANDPTTTEWEKGGPLLTKRAKSVLELAAHEARQHEHNYIASLHLLRALLPEKEGRGITILHRLALGKEEKESRAVTILRQLGVDLDALVDSVEAQLKLQPPSPKWPIPPQLRDHSNTLIRQYFEVIAPGQAVPEHLKALDKQWAELTNQKETAVHYDEYERATEFRQQAMEVEAEFEKLAREWKAGQEQS